MIKLININKAYGDVVALNNVNLEIKKQSIYGIIGQSGAGKSTAIRIMNLLERPDSGAVLFEDTDLTKLENKALLEKRKKISMIFQNFNLFPSRTVYENVAFPLGNKVNHQQVMKYLDFVGLADRKDAYPDQLSGGQKQRVAIARALVTEPDVLLSDESTSALDPETTESILELLQYINQTLNITIVLITHQMEVVKSICDEVAIMENGKVIENGPVESVLPDYFYSRSNLNIDYPSAVFMLKFNNKNVDQSIISDTVKNFDVSINILQGNIEKIGNGRFGVLYISIEGKQINEAIQYISQSAEIKEVK